VTSRTMSEIEISRTCATARARLGQALAHGDGGHHVAPAKLPSRLARYIYLEKMGLLHLEQLSFKTEVKIVQNGRDRLKNLII
jgi:hypothetical protein